MKVFSRSILVENSLYKRKCSLISAIEMFFVNLVPQCSVGGAQVQTGNHKDVKMDCKYRINKWRFTGVLTCEIDGFYVKT